jgi:hypothetical protein
LVAGGGEERELMGGVPAEEGDGGLGEVWGEMGQRAGLRDDLFDGLGAGR